MCLTCGCSPLPHNHHDHDHHLPLGATHEHGTHVTRAVQIEEDILAENNRYAEANRNHFKHHNILALNLVSSPGSGKTTLLVRTLKNLNCPAAVIEGDQTTNLDADRIRETGSKAVQINTGRGCHLDGHMVSHALHDLDLGKGGLDGGVVFIENVGNLVCPSAFDLGENAKVVLLSVTEGDDKPLKYPDMFRASRLMIITKSDLLPHVPYDVDKAVENARSINPDIAIIDLSALTGDGMDTWTTWIEKERHLL